MSNVFDSKPSPEETKQPGYTGPAMLPGMAMIAMFMLMIVLVAGFGALTGKIDPRLKYMVLGMSTLLAVGIFGFLRLRRWGWAIMVAGTLLFTIGYFLFWQQTHAIQPLFMSGFSLIFFLYLIRNDVRVRVR